MLFALFTNSVAIGITVIPVATGFYEKKNRVYSILRVNSTVFSAAASLI